MSAAPRITVRHANRNFGPYSLDEANHLLVVGRLSRDDLAWVEGTPEWVPLAGIPGVVEVPPWPTDGAAHAAEVADPNRSDRRILPAFLLAFFVGVFGVHRFYVGKTGSGIAMLVLTLTLFGMIATAIWAMIDWILIVCGAFRDAEGRLLTQWT
jgi:TM2 domain-containing membrane protein YozV